MGMLYEYDPEDIQFISPHEKIIRRTANRQMDDTKLALFEQGTRYQHYRDLLELWQSGLEVLNRYTFSSDVIRKQQLEAGIFLLQKQLDVACGYEGKAWELREEIDSITRNVDTIKGGRGTPLKKEFRANEKE